jgi:hypothetical protein
LGGLGVKTLRGAPSGIGRARHEPEPAIDSPATVDASGVEISRRTAEPERAVGAGENLLGDFGGQKRAQEPGRRRVHRDPAESRIGRSQPLEHFGELGQ